MQKMPTVQLKHTVNGEGPAHTTEKSSVGDNGPASSNGKAASTKAPDGLPHCDTCQDVRWIRADVPVGHPAFGELVRCPDCGDLAERMRRREVYRRKRERIEKYTQRIGRYRRQTFESFDRRAGEAKTGTVREALEAALQFAEAPSGWLVLTGTKGTGKTHLASAVCNRIEGADLPPERKPLTMYLTAPDLLDLLRSGYDRDDHAELLGLCRDVDVLILDDLGVESGTSAWAREKLYSILNYRYQAELPTVIVTNERLEDLPRRLWDRLADDDLCDHVELVAPSWRQRESAPGRIVY